MINPHLRELYQLYRRGEPVSDEDLGLLLSAIEQAIPFLEASPHFHLVLVVAMQDRDTLNGFRSFRSARKHRK